MRKTVLLAIGFAIVLAGCRGKSDGKEVKEAATQEGQVLLTSKGEVSFSPDGQMYVFTSGSSLAIRKMGDDRVFWLTQGPPVAEKEGESEGKDPAAAPAEPAKEPECVPAKFGDPLPGPQGGWHGHPAWSLDGSFIAFMAPWKDGNCVDGDDVDWDIWVVDVRGLDLATWVKEVVGEKPEGGKGEPRKDYYIVGPAGAGLDFYQVSTAPGADERPAWATCRNLAWSTASAVVEKDLAGIPGICQLTMTELLAICERRATELERNQKQLEKQCEALDTAGTAPSTGEPAPAAAPAPAPAKASAKVEDGPAAPPANP